MDLIGKALRQGGRTLDDIGTLLDFPSGYGRVTRAIVGAVPASRVTVADVDSEMVRFCEEEFGVTGVVVPMNPAALAFRDRYDVIFMGSLLTHFDTPACVEVLHALTGALKRGGLLIFTTHGESCLDHLSIYGEFLADKEHAVRASVSERGFAFVPYPGRDDWGITIHATSFIEQLVRSRFETQLSKISYAARAWGAHHDVWCYERLSDARA